MDLGEVVIARHAMKSSLFQTPPVQLGRPAGKAQDAEGFIGRADQKAALAMSSAEPAAILPQARGTVQRLPLPVQPGQESKLALPGRAAPLGPDREPDFDPGAVEEFGAAATAQNLPLAMLQRSPDQQAQPTPVEASIVNFVQRASEADGSADTGSGPALSLDELAHMVYPLIKRILAVEQERMARRR
jgi:hypothetical protein